MKSKYTEDDYCDIYENKLCDNCGKCLEISGMDTKAIKIEDIAKTKEENKILEEEFLNDLKASLDVEEVKELEENKVDLKALYAKFQNFKELEEVKSVEDSEYEDAFDHIEYLDDSSMFDESNIEDMTEEIYPGVRRFKNKN
ncbi:hypothetical protein [Clostridium uliginosum]|uniref:Uncharacterized protein n=1 Tax=Clostridium uliginosum TaxID=119641 RepID=A0A1I1H0M5_9CLOT|nr:hypothetical protein [Clostridium uliginosum]SFC17296.1 hypothetical protein SAMN05421842_101126 [Clostridium uliginosum]